VVGAPVDTLGRLDTAFNNAAIHVPPSDAAIRDAEGVLEICAADDE
jgi:hypothetical protein